MPHQANQPIYRKFARLALASAMAATVEVDSLKQSPVSEGWEQEFSLMTALALQTPLL